MDKTCNKNKTIFVKHYYNMQAKHAGKNESLRCPWRIWHAMIRMILNFALKKRILSSGGLFSVESIPGNAAATRLNNYTKNSN